MPDPADAQAAETVEGAMRIYFDTEFIEDGRTIDLLSIGMVRENGETYYAEPAEADRSRASEWVQENVLPYLTGPVKPRTEIAAEIVDFVGEDPEFWAWYADYDWVALCQLYGTMMDLPNGWPMFCRDYKQEVARFQPDVIWVPEQTAEDGPEHNAISDAKWLARAWRWHA
jgi:hypothetical protein